MKQTKQVKPLVRRMYVDLETSPNVILAFQIGYKLSIGHHQIVKERGIISICWKWEGESEVHALTWDAKQCDKSMLEKFVKELDEADEVVGHYIDGFDMPWLKTRMMFHRIPNAGKYKTVDTKAWTRPLFLNSNKLDYIAQFLGFGNKIKTDFSLWKEICLNNCPKALAEMVRYNKQDVVLLEKVYHELAFYNAPKTHVAVLNGGEKWQCPHCASKDVHQNKRRVTAAGTVQYQMRCKSCGKTHSINESGHKDYISYKKDQEEKKNK
jgi:DNA polymerase elongation subunit (family B)